MGAVTILGSTVSPCLVTCAHKRYRVLAGRGHPWPSHALATAWLLLAAASHRATALAHCRIAGHLPSWTWATSHLWLLLHGATAAAAAVALCYVVVARLIAMRTRAGSLLHCAVASP